MSRRKKGYACRCSNRKCRARKTLAKSPEDYVRPPVCPSCGGKQWGIATFRNSGREFRSKMCVCHGYHFQHQLGRGDCIHNPDAELRAAVRDGDEAKIAELVNIKIGEIEP